MMAESQAQICRHCEVVLDDETWSPYYRKKNNRICRKCVAKASKKAYWEEPEKRRATYRGHYADHIGAKEKAERDEAAKKKTEAEETAFQAHLKNVKTIDLAWATGLWEAEGSAENRYHSTYKASDGTEHEYYASRLRVSNNDKSLLERFKELMGVGNIAFDKKTTAGNDAFEYYVCGEEAIRVARALWPYVVSEYRHNCIKEMTGEEWQVTDGYKSQEEKLVWVAGIFEGEGCAGWYFVKVKTASPKWIDGRWENGWWVQEMVIGNTQRDMLDKIAQIVGFGKTHPHKDARGNYKPQFQYGLSALRARDFANMILGYVFQYISMVNY